MNIFRTLTLSLSAVIAPVSLMAQSSIHANIPFDFNVGTKTFAAGEYRVQHVAPLVLAIVNPNGSTAMMVQANNAYSTTVPLFPVSGIPGWPRMGAVEVSRRERADREKGIARAG
jgi:hypothetical protein